MTIPGKMENFCCWCFLARRVTGGSWVMTSILLTTFFLVSVAWEEAIQGRRGLFWQFDGMWSITGRKAAYVCGEHVAAACSHLSDLEAGSCGCLHIFSSFIPPKPPTHGMKPWDYLRRKTYLHVGRFFSSGNPLCIALGTHLGVYLNLLGDPVALAVKSNQHRCSFL